MKLQTKIKQNRKEYLTELIKLPSKLRFEIYLISLLFTLFFISAPVAIIINLYFPKMEWTNPTTVVKQSASVMITILGILILILVVVAVSVVLVKVFNITNMMIILSSILIIFLIYLFVSIKILNYIGNEKFSRL